MKFLLLLIDDYEMASRRKSNQRTWSTQLYNQNDLDLHWRRKREKIFFFYFDFLIKMLILHLLINSLWVRSELDFNYKYIYIWEFWQSLNIYINLIIIWEHPSKYNNNRLNCAWKQDRVRIARLASHIIIECSLSHLQAIVKSIRKK